MKSKFNVVLAVGFIAVFCAIKSGAAEKSTSDLPLIFNGTNLAGWKVPKPNPFWKIADGVLVGENDDKLTGHTLHTEKAYKDFVIELEVRWNGEVDTGIMLRKPELQMQMGISRSLKRDKTGSC